jgi:type VI protein secretion system component Hcp
VKPLTKLMDAPSQPTENISLNFTKIQYDYKPQ